MRNFKLTIEYDGTDYLGWQRQGVSSGAKVIQSTVQGTIENAIYKITNDKVNLIGSGRTDTGVHARGQVANFKTDNPINLEKLGISLNSVLPGDILIKHIEEVDIDFNCRYSAKNKEYRYSIINSRFCPPLCRKYYTHVNYPLDFKLMRKESKILLGKHNFKAFKSYTKKNISSVRKITKITLNKDHDIITIDIASDGFLYKMVRSIAGTLIEIGRGKFPPGSMKQILKSKDRKLAGPVVPPQGLCLMNVSY